VQSYRSRARKIAKEPWYRLFAAICTRCYSIKCSYYKRGIKNYLSPEDLKMMWFRDNAPLMEKPSVDRIDGDGHYTLENTRIIEYKENLRLSGISKRLKLKGKKFNKLLVIGSADINDLRTYWPCLCDCGNNKTVMGKHLINGTVKSCGCARHKNWRTKRKEYAERPEKP
jgi:hypothetical protein